jgi:hypothetical protein
MLTSTFALFFRHSYFDIPCSTFIPYPVSLPPASDLQSTASYPVRWRRFSSSS